MTPDKPTPEQALQIVSRKLDENRHDGGCATRWVNEDGDKECNCDQAQVDAAWAVLREAVADRDELDRGTERFATDTAQAIAALEAERTALRTENAKLKGIIYFTP